MKFDSGTSFQRWFSRWQLRAKVTLGVVLPLVVILGAFTAIEYSRHQSVVLTNLSLLASHSGEVIENNLRQQMLRSDFDELQALLDSIGSTGHFRIVYLLDTSGKVIFAPNQEGVGTVLDNREPDCQACHQLQKEERQRSVVVRGMDGQRVFRTMNPIENSPDCAQCHDPNERLIGLLLTDIPLTPIEAPLASHLRESLLWWAGTILVVVVVVNVAISKLVLQRLKRLSDAIAGFGRGRMPAPVADSQSDEIGQLSAAFNSMAVQVEARSTENLFLSENLQRQSSLRGELLKRLITIQEDERKRIARELHDGLGQALGALAFRVGGLRHLIGTDRDRAVKELDTTKGLIQTATEDMYDLILALRPSVLDDLGLEAAVRSHAERVLEGTGIEFSLEAEAVADRLPSEIEVALYRIFQEALTNILRHADAGRVLIKLYREDSVFIGEVIDDGKGFDLAEVNKNGSETRGFGIMGMQERIGLIGGEMEVQSTPGKGTRLSIRIPLWS